MMDEFKYVVNLAGEIFGHPFTVMLYGLIIHFLKSMAQIKVGTGNVISIPQYYWQNPWQTLLCIFSSLAGYFILIPEEYGKEMNLVVSTNAFAIGYMSDSIADMLGRRSNVFKEDK